MMIETLTAILVVITGFYAYVTFKISKANEATVAAVRDQSEALTRPYVVVSPYLPPKGQVIYLRIQNSGRTAASNLRLQLDRDFFQFGEVQESRNLRLFTAFSQPIDQFPPDAQILFALAQGSVIHCAQANEAVTPKTFTVDVTYSYGDRTVSEAAHIDLRPYGQSVPPPDPLIDKLDDIKKAIQDT